MAYGTDQLTSETGLWSCGFEGFLTIKHLRNQGYGKVPEEKGCYLVIRKDKMPPVFLNVGTGGFFKQKNPNVPISILKKEWVDDALIIFVGLAGHNSNGTLRNRIKLLIEFGMGKSVGHSGGRLIWQLKNTDELAICWKTTQDESPRAAERNLIQDFKKLHGGRRPFANLQD